MNAKLIERCLQRELREHFPKVSCQVHVIPYLHFFNIQISDDTVTPRMINQIKRIIARWYYAADGSKIHWGRVYTEKRNED